jgi:photosystem II stability/assembly factor-like uncharacterized protein
MKTLNLMFGMRECAINYQNHMGACGRADDYFASEMAFHWERSYRGDLGMDRLSKVEGDNAPTAVTVPWSAEIGPVLIDFLTEFQSAQVIAETEAILDLVFLESECFEDCKSQEDAGKNGYAVTGALAGSPVNISNVWYTENKGQTWAESSARPFTGGEDISSVVIQGVKNDHRIVVARGTTDAGNPAEIAYADVTSIGTVSWVYVNVGSVNGQYINKLLWTDSSHMFAITNDGYIYKSSNGGVTWVVVLSTAINPLNGIAGLHYGPNAGTVWVVGDNNTVYLSEDNGSTWSAVTGPSPADDLTTVAVTPDGTVFIGNDTGEIWGSYDEGTDWALLPAQGITATGVDDIKVWGDSNIWAAVNTASGGRVVRSTDGGAAFRLWRLNIPTNSGLNILAVVDPNTVYVAGEPNGGLGFISRTNSTLLGEFTQKLIA